MVRKMDIKERMIELESFKYCEENGISTGSLESDQNYCDFLPHPVLDRISKKWAKPSFDMAKVCMVIAD